MRYLIVKTKTKHYLLSNSSAVIIEALLKDRAPISYTDLHRATKISISSLYTFVARLRKAGLVTTKRMSNQKESLIKIRQHLTSVPITRVG